MGDASVHAGGERWKHRALRVLVSGVFLTVLGLAVYLPVYFIFSRGTGPLHSLGFWLGAVMCGSLGFLVGYVFHGPKLLSWLEIHPDDTVTQRTVRGVVNFIFFLPPLVIYASKPPDGEHALLSVANPLWLRMTISVVENLFILYIYYVLWFLSLSAMTTSRSDSKQTRM